MDSQRVRNLQTSYERIAEEYATRIAGELAHKPLDRQLLDRFAESVRGQGLVCDMGCGPGHIARYLRDRGLEVCGVDLSPEMVMQALRLNPDISFSQGDMLALDVAEASWAGIAAFYAIVHIPREEMRTALRELRRVLMPGGQLLLAFHVGEETVHREEMWGREVSLDFLFFRSKEIEAHLRAAGFEVEETIERPPYPDIEHPSQRAYIFANKV